MSYFQRQIFDIFDPLTLEIVGKKRRIEVHQSGDWHLATMGFIVRKAANSSYQFEILVQSRSEYVDIGQHRSDQSIASQMLVEDDGEPEHAIRRGLSEELGLNNRDIQMIVPWNKMGSLYISKKYEDSPVLWNRELMINYLIVLRPGIELKMNFKVDNYRWVPWEEFSYLVKIHPKQYTKSVRMYCVDEQNLEKLTSDFESLIVGNRIDPVCQRMYYVSYGNRDYLVKENTLKSGQIMNNVFVFDTTSSITKICEFNTEETNYFNKVLLDDSILDSWV